MYSNVKFYEKDNERHQIHFSNWKLGKVLNQMLTDLINHYVSDF